MKDRKKRELQDKNTDWEKYLQNTHLLKDYYSNFEDLLNINNQKKNTIKKRLENFKTLIKEDSKYRCQ